jgi:hypothetical protein
MSKYTIVESYFRNLDYSKLPEQFSNFIKTEILTDPELKYLSEREPIFIEIKEKVEKYQNQNVEKVITEGSNESQKSIVEKQIRGLKLLVPMLEDEQKAIVEKQIRGLQMILTLV